MDQNDIHWMTSRCPFKTGVYYTPVMSDHEREVGEERQTLIIVGECCRHNPKWISYSVVS